MFFDPPHWVVDGYKTTNQFEAWKLGKTLNTTPQFYFYNDQYDKENWSKEPSESWEALCYDRCLSLRHRYKKLSLFYSAGRDSHHILNCFLYFNIYLDEIVLIEWALNSKRNKELKEFIYPQVNLYRNFFPKTKITQIKVDKSHYDSYFVDDWLEKKYTSFSCGLFQPTQYAYYANKVLKADELNNGVIFGLDKPRILLHNNKYYSSVLDKTLEVYLCESPNIIYFYYAPEMPKFHIKQTWMTLNHIEKKFKGQITSEFLTEYCGNSHSDYYDDFCLSCGRGPAFDITASIQNGKNKYRNHGRDPVFQNLLKLGLDEKWKSAQNFKDAFDYTAEKYSDIFPNNDPFLAPVGLYSKMYYLKDAEVEII